MSKNNQDFTMFDGIGAGGQSYATVPIQTLPDKKKTKSWKKATVDALERHGIRQLHQNLVFREWKAMAEGRFTYLGTGVSDFQELPWFDKEIRTLRDGAGIPTHIKHFDIVGIIANALTGVYKDMDDRYRVESIDEYSTNEYIRQKTEMLHQFAQTMFMQELDKMLMIRGIDPNKQDFQSEEEAQAHQQQVQQQVQSLTPPEIEEFLSKNFKVLATEWAQNVITADKKRFYLEAEDIDLFLEYILTGRSFRHYRVGYDNYDIESWRVEEVFFSQEVDAKYPQDGEFVGRITSMPVSSLLNRYGHLMNATQQERIGNYWEQEVGDWDAYRSGARVGSKKVRPDKFAFPEPTTVPFHNYYDHSANLQLEDALGVPLATKTIIDDDGNEESFSSWIPREDEDPELHSSVHSTLLRDDIEVRRDTVRVTEGYWRSSKKMYVLIHENDYGQLAVDLVDDNLMSDYLEEEEIKTKKTLSLQQLQKALKDDNLTEYKNTLTPFYVPEVWRFVKIRGNGSTIQEDMYLDVRPLDFQIKGSDSNLFDVKLPVSGIIGTGIAPKIEPYQQLHNISMNQITELLEKELGVFFTFDITGLSEEYQDETTEEAIYRLRDNIKDTGIAGFDLSRQNTQGNQPNLFQRHEVVYATQVQYRWQLAQQYKQEAFNQIGITPQMLGQPNTYTTAEGIKQGAQASYALVSNWFDRFNTAKAKGMEVHLAVAQYCETEGKSANLITRKGDGELRFLDIIKEDGEIFPMRNLSVHPETSYSERKMVEQIRQFVLNDNTIDRTFEDVIDLMTNPVLVEIQQQAKAMERRKQQKVQEDRQFQQQMQQNQIQAEQEKDDKEHEQEKEITSLKVLGNIEEARIRSLGSASSLYTREGAEEDVNEAADRVTKNLQTEQNLNLKAAEHQRKVSSDSEAKKIELMKLAQKSEELRLKNRALDVKRETSYVNKN